MSVLAVVTRRASTVTNYDDRWKRFIKSAKAQKTVHGLP